MMPYPPPLPSYSFELEGSIPVMVSTLPAYHYYCYYYIPLNRNVSCQRWRCLLVGHNVCLRRERPLYRCLIVPPARNNELSDNRK